MAKKRILVLSDLHCGHNIGLTPPPWQYGFKARGSTRRNKWAIIQKELWNSFDSILRKVKPYDLCFFLGDAIDGKGKKSGGVETVTGSVMEQCDMAVNVFDHTRLYAKKGYKIFSVYGTDYHTAIDGEDAEDIIAREAKFEKIGGHEWVDVNGCVFDLKHKVGSSSIPHGRHTAVSKEYMWAQQWALRKMAPMPNVVLRGHAHYNTYAGGTDWLAMICPALQGMGSRFGARQCSGLVDWGLVTFDVDTDGSFDWQIHTVRLDSQRAKAEVV